MQSCNKWCRGVRVERGEEEAISRVVMFVYDPLKIAFMPNFGSYHHALGVTHYNNKKHAEKISYSLTCDATKAPGVNKSARKVLVAHRRVNRHCYSNAVLNGCQILGPTTTRLVKLADFRGESRRTTSASK